MSEKKLKIVIMGGCGSGKSTAAQVIMDALSKHGIECDYKNPDNLGLDEQGMLFAKASESLQGLVVTVDEVQTQRKK